MDRWCDYAATITNIINGGFNHARSDCPCFVNARACDPLTLQALYAYFLLNKHSTTQKPPVSHSRRDILLLLRCGDQEKGHSIPFVRKTGWMSFYNPSAIRTKESTIQHAILKLFQPSKKPVVYLTPRRPETRDTHYIAPGANNKRLRLRDSPAKTRHDIASILFVLVAANRFVIN